MNIFEEFISAHGVTILYSIVTAIFGYIGIAAKNLYKKYVDDKTKKSIAKMCVGAVEQIYKDLHGEEKLDKALEAFAEILNDRGIKVTTLEMRMLVESAVSEFNNAFDKTSKE